jgi:scyllo-inositol 2-dehydrogenase (NADP+)
MIRVGLVGFGMAGKVFHAPFIAAVEGLELAAVVERHGRNAEAAYPGIVTYPSLEATLEDKSLELIVIATPNSSHAELAHQALAAGRHVVVDKPVAPTAPEIASLTDAAKANGRLLIPFHNRRWDSDFQTLRKVISEQSVGRVVYFESTFDRWRPVAPAGVWRNDGSPETGLLLDLCTHLADQALVLFGWPGAVSAEVSRERDGAVSIDAFTVRLRYPEMAVTLSANALAAQPRPRFTLRGTHGSFVKYGLDPQEDRLKQDPKFAIAGFGDEPESAWGTLSEMGSDGPLVQRRISTIPGTYRDYYAGVRDAILGKSAAPVGAADAYRVARILDLALESSGARREMPCGPDA